MRKFISILLAILMVFSVTACSKTRADKRGERHKGSVAESRVRDRRKLQNNSTDTSKTNTTDVDENEAVKTDEVITLRLAEVHETGYPTTLADEKFAELVKKETNGRIIIEVHADGKLGSESDVIEAMQAGTIDFARVSVSPMAAYYPKLNTLSLPYIFNDSNHMWTVLNSTLGQEMLDGISNADLVGLAWYDGGARNFFANRKIEKFEDFKGLRVRMQKNDLMFGLAKALGCEPYDMAMGDINTSIEQGILDGAENNIPTYESYKHCKFAPYYILDSHSRIPEILAGSKKTFDKLSADDQKILKKYAKETQEYEISEWSKREVEAKKSIEKQGAIIITLDDSVKAQINTACEPLYKQFGADYQDVIKEIKSMAK